MSIKTNNGTANVTTQDTDASVITLEKVTEVRDNCELMTVREKAKQEIIASGKIEQLTALISLDDNNTILEFGKQPAEEIAKVADKVLEKYDMTMVNNTATLVDTLLSIMKKIDIAEIKSASELMEERKKKSFFDRFKESAQQKLDKLVNKYRAIGNEMETICSQLKTYEDGIKQSNKDIATMYEAAMVTYKQLEEYIVAGEQAITEIEEYKAGLEKQFAETGDEQLQFDIQNVGNQLTLMEQRVADLRGAESIALQSVPTFKIQEYTNANLARKINSAFIVTVPAFKTALVNSVVAKQQNLTAQGLSALDEATSYLVRKNAENSVKQLQVSQQLANSSAVKADDIEYSWRVIMDGITKYKEMENQYREIRKEEAKRIEAANSEYMNKLAKGGAF